MPYQQINVKLNERTFAIGCHCFALKEIDSNIFFDALCAEEAELAGKFRASSRALQYAAGRYSAKHALLSLSGQKAVSFRHIHIGTGVWGFPYVASRELADYNISISHTEEVAASLCTPSEIPAGIDIEVLDQKNDTLIFSQLNSKERELLNNFPPGQQNTTLHLFWAAKEAAGKALRTGFRLPVQNFDISDIADHNGFYHIRFGSLNMLTVFAVSKLGKVLAIALPAGSGAGDNLAAEMMRILSF